ncbi:hypothetical protein [Nafulsella turpanensis]|uniref:hypothetical protein n=1 Tax=Nafulsella turpanensis TaxID=1265690 RepID=UPI000347016E|nr:hypothetical protein [Nafulsella turpanensis]
MEKHPYCTSEVFKKDISELCEFCPLVDIIENAIQNQIIAQADIQKEILSKPAFEGYLNREIESAQKRMEKEYLEELRNKDYKKDPGRQNRIIHFIWNKERIKALNKFFDEHDSSAKRVKKSNVDLEEATPKSLKELFIKPEFVGKCIDILKEVVPNLIDGNNNYLKAPKAAFVLWVEELRRRPFIKPIKDEFIIAKLLNSYFLGLNIDPTYFRKADLGKRTESKRLEMQIKLSQFAQEERGESRES